MKERKTTHVISIIILLVCATTLTIRGVSSPTLPLLCLDPSTYNATSLGEEFTININITDVYNLQSVELKLGFNTTILDATHVAEGPFLASFGETSPYLSINNTAGYVLIAIALTSGGPAEGSGTLATVTFNATYHGPVSCALHLYDTQLEDPSSLPIEHETSDGYYGFLALLLNVTTNKQLYAPGTSISIYGNLTRNYSPVSGLVALRIANPSNITFVYRTLRTGSTTPAGNITILEVVPSDAYGNPLQNFPKGQYAHFKITVRNNGTKPELLTITINAYDVSSTTIGAFAYPQYLVPSGSTLIIIPFLMIPEWALTGNATVYASALSYPPQFAYCPEKSATFKITGGTPTPGPPPNVTGQTSFLGSYNLTFKLPSNLGIGNYTVTVGSKYQGLDALKTTMFKIKVPGDANGDGHVTVNDLAILGGSWYRCEGDPRYDPRADFNGDGCVKIGDLAILGANWYRY